MKRWVQGPTDEELMEEHAAINAANLETYLAAGDIPDEIITEMLDVNGALRYRGYLYSLQEQRWIKCR